MGLTGWKAHNTVLLEHGTAPLGLLSYLRSGDFASAVFENWESEFLQMAAYVILTAFLFQRGSAELRDPDGDEDSPSTPPPSGFASFLHAYSLGIALAWSVHCLVRPAPLGKLPGGSDGSGPAWRPAAFADRSPRRHGVLVRSLSRTGSPSFWRQRPWSSCRSFCGSAARLSRSMWTRATTKPGARRAGGVHPARRAAAADHDAPLRRHATSLRAGDGVGACLDAARAAADRSALRARP